MIHALLNSVCQRLVAGSDGIMPSEDFQFGQGFVGPQRLAISAIFQAFIVMLDGADEITSLTAQMC